MVVPVAAAAAAPAASTAAGGGALGGSSAKLGAGGEGAMASKSRGLPKKPHRRNHPKMRREQSKEQSKGRRLLMGVADGLNEQKKEQQSGRFPSRRRDSFAPQ